MASVMRQNKTGAIQRIVTFVLLYYLMPFSTAVGQQAKFYADFPLGEEEREMMLDSDNKNLKVEVPENILDIDSETMKAFAYNRWKPIWEWEWIINGRRLTWNSDTVFITPNPEKTDTIIWNRTEKKIKKSDTILCTVRFPDTYRISYNPCCYGFNVFTGKKYCYWPKFSIQLLNSNGNTVVGILDGTEKNLDVEGNTELDEEELRHVCPKSAMETNVSFVSIEESSENISWESDGIRCYGGGWENSLASFKYVALDSMPVFMKVDVKAAKVDLFKYE